MYQHPEPQLAFGNSSAKETYKKEKVEEIAKDKDEEDTNLSNKVMNHGITTENGDQGEVYVTSNKSQDHQILTVF